MTYHVRVGEDAVMTFPDSDLCWEMRYGPKRNFAAAGALESFRNLALECTKEEAWRRIQCIRKAVKQSTIEGQ